MQTNDANLNTGKKPRGRKNADKQEAIIDNSIIKARIEEMVKLKKASDTASDEFSEAIKFVAESAGLNASAVRKFVLARAGEHFEDKKKECEQLSLLFEEVGG